MFAGWRNVSTYLKMQRVKTQEFWQNVHLLQRRSAVNKWRSRKNATKIARLRLKKLVAKFHHIRKMLVFRELKA